MRLVWVGRKAVDDGDGGAIYDTRMRAALARVHEVTLIEAVALDRRTQIASAAVRLSTPETFAYGRVDDVAAIADAARDADAVIFSHEYLDRLAAAVRRATPEAPPFVTVRHNVVSDLMHQALSDAPPVAALYGAFARRAERQALGGPLFAGVVALSARDRRLIEAIAGRSDIGLALPGAPPPVPLAADAALADELVLSGTYGWVWKGRDLRRFVREASATPPPWSALHMDWPLDSAAAAALRVRPARELDPSAAIRFGLITDRFAAGHKLKTAAYLMANCRVITFADVAEDFAFSPLAQRWIHRVASVAEIGPVMRTALAQPAGVARAELEALKREIAATLDWSTQADEIVAAVSRATRTIAPRSS